MERILNPRLNCMGFGFLIVYVLFICNNMSFTWNSLQNTSCTHMISMDIFLYEPCNDCLVPFCCEPCAMCQEYRELKYRGFDMSLGWHGNTDRQNGGVVMPEFAFMEMKH
uniref:Uncharacterized protein n=1 Tax=Lactuca sativa TaxID=4236 RepID=A0A9R1XGD4_LACSA|nr:hypothetical protein LSAT_V11C400162450 [Lactuca sativa]